MNAIFVVVVVVIAVAADGMVVVARAVAVTVAVEKVAVKVVAKVARIVARVLNVVLVLINRLAVNLQNQEKVLRHHLWVNVNHVHRKLQDQLVSVSLVLLRLLAEIKGLKAQPNCVWC